MGTNPCLPAPPLKGKLDVDIASILNNKLSHLLWVCLSGVYVFYFSNRLGDLVSDWLLFIEIAEDWSVGPTLTPTTDMSSSLL